MADEFLTMKTKLKNWIVLALALIGVSGLVQAAEKDRPNMVFILIDDLRWDGLSATGHPFVKTPNIDRIGKEGAIFQNAFVTTPLCSPARGSFMTGQYVHTHGIKGNGGQYAEPSHRLVSFSKLLRESGYESAYVGKLHMGADDSPRPGFDHWVSFKGQGVFENPAININGKSQKTEGYMTDILNEHAVKFIKQEHKKPFVLYFAHKAVHGPFTPAERHRGRYADANWPEPPNMKDSLEGKPAVTREVEDKNPKRAKANPKKRGLADSAEGDSQKTQKAQMECMLSIDEGVGQIFKALEEAGQLDNTIIMFTSDNGYFWGEHGLSDKRWAYEESIRVPLLVRYPKLVKAGSNPPQLALNIDIAPTLLELGGVKIPSSVEGKSLLPVLKDPGAQLRKYAFMEYFKEETFPRQPTWQAVRTADWKYIHYPELNSMDELYNLKTDRYEMKNLIAEKSAEATLKELKTELNKTFK
jgi:arylsulfatase A-like enzyme